MHPWLDPPIDDDVFSLVVKRSIAFGWCSFNRAGHPAAVERWGHNDAGGDWSAPDAIRQIAWAQVAAVEGLDLPILALITTVTQSLWRVGSIEVTGLHAVIPMRLATDNRSALAGAREWFRLADPHAKTHCSVRISAGPTNALVGAGEQIAGRVADMTANGIEVMATNGGQQFGGLRSPLAGETQQRNLVPVLHLDVLMCEWTTDSLAWLVESFVEALRQIGQASRVLIEVSRNDRQ